MMAGLNEGFAVLQVPVTATLSSLIWFRFEC